MQSYHIRAYHIQCNPMRLYSSPSPLESVGIGWSNSAQNCTEYVVAPSWGPFSIMRLPKACQIINKRCPANAITTFCICLLLLHIVVHWLGRSGHRKSDYYDNSCNTKDVGLTWLASEWTRLGLLPTWCKVMLSNISVQLLFLWQLYVYLLWPTVANHYALCSPQNLFSSLYSWQEESVECFHGPTRWMLLSECWAANVVQLSSIPCIRV